MKMKYFGVAWNPFILSLSKAETPTGEICAWCDEPIEEQNNGLIIPHFGENEAIEHSYHSECFVRTVVGSTLHQKKQCICFGGKEEESGILSKRQAAIEAVELFGKNKFP